MTNYTQSCIYKIASKDPAINDIYIGSTCNFIKRRYKHKSCCNNPNANEYNYYVYRFIRNNGGWCNFNLYIIEQFNCTSKIQKEQVERAWIEQLKPSLNKRVPANYQMGDVFSKSEYDMGYRSENKEAIKERTKEYGQKTIHCPCCNHDINLHHKARHNKSKKHITNSSTSESESSEEEQDTMMTEMNKMRDDSELKLQEMKNICDNIDKFIN